MRIPERSIAGTGLFALDVVLRLDGSAASPSLGGSAGNVLAILGALGWSSTPVGVIGDDAAARTIVSDFERVGADVRHLRRSCKGSTPVVFQHQLESAEATHRFSFACPACGTRRRPWWDEEHWLTDLGEALPAARVFYLDRPTRLGVKLAERYARQGTVVVFEPSAIGDDTDLFARALKTAGIVKYSDERLDGLGFDLSPGTVEIQTRGAQGLRFRISRAQRSWSYLSAFRLPYVHDTAGAGDWCTAGLLFEMFSQSSTSPKSEAMLARGLAFGQALSTLNCMTEGARGLLATWSADRIVQAARELAKQRLQADSESVRHHESHLSELAGDIGQQARSDSSRANGFDCCSPS